MRKYIVNITTILINTHGLYAVYQTIEESGNSKVKNEHAFITHARGVIRRRDVNPMSPETLGKIMCSFEGCEVPDLQRTHSFSSPEEALRYEVAEFLAYSIWLRFNPYTQKVHCGRFPEVPPYPEPKKKTDADYNVLSGNFGP